MSHALGRSQRHRNVMVWDNNNYGSKGALTPPDPDHRYNSTEPRSEG